MKDLGPVVLKSNQIALHNEIHLKIDVEKYQKHLIDKVII